MKLNRTRRTALFFTSLCGLATIAIAGPLAGAASAATSPTISYNFGGNFSGSGFTPGGLVYVQEQVGTTVIGSTTVRASEPHYFCYYIAEDHTWECETITPGGTIAGTLSPDPEASLSCGVMESGTVSAKDETTGAIANLPETWVGMC